MYSLKKKWRITFEWGSSVLTYWRKKVLYVPSHKQRELINAEWELEIIPMHNFKYFQYYLEMKTILEGQMAIAYEAFSELFATLGSMVKQES